MRRHENLLVVVDQFEELFRFPQSAKPRPSGRRRRRLRQPAARSRAQPRQPIYVVLTMRSDFLGDCAQFRDLPEAINDGQYLIPRLTRDQRRDTIEGPVAVGGAEIAPRLMQRLLNDVGDDPDPLPILQHALMRTWDAWKAATRGRTPDRPRRLPACRRDVAGVVPACRPGLRRTRRDPGCAGGGADAVPLPVRAQRGLPETCCPTWFYELCEVAATDARAMTRVIDAFRPTAALSSTVPAWPVPLEPDSVINIFHETLIRHSHPLRDWVQRETRSATLNHFVRQTALMWP